VGSIRKAFASPAFFDLNKHTKVKAFFLETKHGHFCDYPNELNVVEL
jgi:hypothetical protein